MTLSNIGKAPENTRRVALVLAVGRDGKGAVVTERDADYACRLVKYLMGDLIRVVRETVSESPDEKAKKRIVQIVADAGSRGNHPQRTDEEAAVPPQILQGRVP